MSDEQCLYSGFTTKQQETFYNTLLEKAVILIASKLAEILPPSNHDMKFLKHVRKIYKYLQQLDKQKQTMPKFSKGIEPLYNFIKDNVDTNSDAMSTLTS